jgi:hypothetical protein
MSRTILLQRDQWDLCLTASRSIATCTGPYALAQDAASACRLFLGELWYDTRQGVPYFEQILGRFPSLGYVKAQLQAAALTVPGVVSAACFIDGIEGRTVTGQVQITTADGSTAAAAF